MNGAREFSSTDSSTWHGVRGHQSAVERFQQMLASGRMASTFLLAGPAGIGKRMLALQLAKALLCHHAPAGQLEACGKCPDCVQVDNRSHPDLELIARPADKAFIPLELLIGDKEHRMRAGLCFNLSLRPRDGGRKVAIIDDADYLNKEGANALLKTLEEPPPRSVLMLLGTSEQRQLPTIRSRCQIIRMEPLDEHVVCEILLAKQLCASPEEALRVAQLSQGSMERAKLLLADGVIEFRRDLLASLSTLPLQTLACGRLVSQFVDAAGKEAPAKRARMKQVLEMAMQLYSNLLHAAATSTAPEIDDRDHDMSTAVAKLYRVLGAYPERIADLVDLAIDAQQHVDGNVNLAGLAEWWTGEISSLTTKLARPAGSR